MNYSTNKDYNIMQAAHTRLDDEFINEDRGIYKIGDYIASSFYDGDYTKGIEDLKENRISTVDFLKYLESVASEHNCAVFNLFSGHFDTQFFIYLAEDNR
jgi:hypothetical protein